MPLTTRCSHCGRLFPVQAQQLKARRGNVACPQCGKRFNAVAGLLDEAVSGAPARSAAGAIGDASEGASTAPADMLDLDEERVKAVRAGAMIWSIGILLLMIGLVLQLGWWDRGRWMQHPKVSAAVDTVCATIGCRPEPPRVAGALEVLNQALAPGVEHPGGLRLTLTLINQSDVAQRLPLLQLELYDDSGKLTAARRLEPELYLTDSDHSRGLSAGASVRPTLDLAPLPHPAAAFRIKLF